MQNNCKKVAAAVFQKDKKFLIAQRAKKDALEGKWEFPGGKQEPGESLEECLKRELDEEFGIQVEVGSYICSSFFQHKGSDYEMLAFKIKSFTGEFELREHKEIKWVASDEFQNYEFPEPDLPIIQELKKQE